MESRHHIILFDGECNFCSFWVKFVIKRDPKNKFRFASLQSEKGQDLLRKFNVNLATDSVVLIDNNKGYVKSTAVLRVLKNMGGALSLFYCFIIIPQVVRDFFYAIIASVRYKVFGKSTCELPANSDYQERFL